MKKNYLCCIRLETEFLDSLKKRASEEGINLSEFIRRMLKQPTKLDKIELMLGEIHKKFVRK
jgi:predicted DNA binding CopG/RHH family protein